MGPEQKKVGESLSAHLREEAASFPERDLIYTFGGS